MKATSILGRTFGGLLLLAAAYLVPAEAASGPQCGKLGQPSCPPERNVLTQHNDAQRTGAYLAEVVLTPTNIATYGLGKAYTRNVVGFILSQPLYVENVRVPEGNHFSTKNLVIVATSKNQIYAFDAQSTDLNPSGGVVWHASLMETARTPSQFLNRGVYSCPTTVGPLGITGTPVIDPGTQTLYLVAMDHANRHLLHAIDIRTGVNRLTPQTITWPDASLPFKGGLELNRPALLLARSTVFIAFGSRCDRDGEGWVFAYRTADLAQIGHYTTTDQQNGLSTVWQSGNGLVANPGDDAIYFMTGNGNGHSESFVKLSLGPLSSKNIFASAAYFRPDNASVLDSGNSDLSSGGPVYLPGNRIIGGGKQGRFYVTGCENDGAVAEPDAEISRGATQVTRSAC